MSKANKKHIATRRERRINRWGQRQLAAMLADEYGLYDAEPIITPLYDIRDDAPDEFVEEAVA